MNKRLIFALITICMMTLTACSGGDKKVSFETVESARTQANENSEFNARKWKSDNAPTLKIKSRGDSTQSSKCPQGDGWASIDLVNPESGKTVIKLKCSTASGNIGCLEEKDFATKTYAQEDGKCNDEIPFPLPKILK